MENEKKGLGGWLILVGIGVVVGPIKLLMVFSQVYLPIFKDGSWELLTTEGSQAYHALWAPMMIGEISYNAFMLIISLYLVYLFFSKHYLFPKVYIAIVGLSLVFIPLDAWVLTIIMPNEPMFDPETTKEFARTIISALIWVPYLLVSERVKATFVENKPLNEMRVVVENAK